MTKQTTIRDIAEAAGVSIATVSNVINGVDKVSAEVKDRVIQVMLDMDYHINLAARSLTNRHSDLLGLILPITNEGPDSMSLILRDNLFYGEFLSGVEHEAANLGYDIIVKGIRPGESCRDWVLKRNLDGAIFIGNFPEVLTGDLQRLGRKLVLVDCYLNKKTKSSIVRIDDEQGAYLATKHLLSLGHRKIALAVSNIDVEGPIRQRYLGFLRAMKEYNLEPSKEQIIINDISFSGGYTVGKALISMPNITAVFAVADVIAFGILKAMREANKRVPNDLSIVGFDNLRDCEFSDPPLTTVAQHVFERGCRAVEVLVNAIEKKNSKRVQEILPVELRLRDSVRSLHIVEEKVQ